MALKRLQSNPLLTPDDLAPTREDLEVMCTLNPAAVRFGDEILLLVRVGERPVPQAGYVSCLYFDAEEGCEKIVRIPDDDPDLTQPDNRWCRYRGRMMLSSMSHLRIARGSDGVYAVPRP